MKFLMMTIMAALLVGAGSAGGYFFSQKQAVASYSETGPISKEQQQANKFAKMSAEEKAKHLRFVKLDPIVLPIIDSNGVSQVVTLVVSLEVNGDDNAEFAASMTPRLKDAYIQDMYGVLNRKASMEGGVIKVDELKERLNRISAKVLGENKVNSVLLQVVNQRPI
ncbi:MAG: flagellar basal body-associated FliL family protein [Pseudomonadota bacterium]